jgi:four helix bundle protein
MTTSKVVNEAPWERLKAWQACHQLVLAIYRATRKMPKDDDHLLTTELRQAAMTASVNICMGSTSKSREFRSFLQGSLGKLAVVSCLLLIIDELEYLPKDKVSELEILRDHAAKLTGGLYRAVGKSVKDIKEQQSG